MGRWRDPRGRAVIHCRLGTLEEPSDDQPFIESRICGVASARNLRNREWLMRLIIDGRRLTAERTGVGRYLEVLLQDWAETGAPLPETLVVLRDRAGLTRIPSRSGIRAEASGEGLPGLVWEQ